MAYSSQSSRQGSLVDGISKQLKSPSTSDEGDSQPVFTNEEWQEKNTKKVELSIKCRGLKDADIFSKSDPMVVLFIKSLKDKDKWVEFGRTEEIKNTLNPDFVHKFIIDFLFEEKQKLKFQVYDIDSKSRLLEKHDFLGSAHYDLAEIVSSKYKGCEKPLKLAPLKFKGCITVTAEELENSADVISMKWAGKKLDKKDFFGKSDPFMVFSRCNENSSYTVCHKTEVIKYTLNPTWETFEIPVRTLCNGEFDRNIRVEVYDWDRDGGHDLIGTFSTSLRRLEKGRSKKNEYECINEKKKKKKRNYKNSGLLTLLEFRIEKRYTFLDYFNSGTDLSFVVAIDFTDSNRDPRKPDSLHYFNSSELNQYAIAIRAVGEIVERYDSDNLFPAYGFGARIPTEECVSHLFPLNFYQQNPDCQGIDGVLEAYQDCIRRVTLDSPTHFSPVIRKVSEKASRIRDASEYFVLLIITDGVINDMDATKEAIVNAAKLPMSIIIVGVGKADFTNMKELDGDEVRLSFGGVKAERDIVQFVPLKDHIADGRNQVLSKARLAKEVLEEIPDQLEEYMRKRNLVPRNMSPKLTRRVTEPTSDISRL